MEHGASSPGSSRNVVRTHLGGPLNCSVYKVIFFSTSSRDYVPDLDLETKFSLISTIKGWITPSPNHLKLFELSWIEFSQMIFAMRLQMMSKFWAETSFFYQLLVRRLNMIACISRHPPPLPKLSIFIQRFKCVLYARGIFLSRLCALFPSPHSVHNTAGKTGTQNCDPQDGIQLKFVLSLKNVRQAASPHPPQSCPCVLYLGLPHSLFEWDQTCLIEILWEWA